MTRFLNRYKYFLVILGVNLILLIGWPELGWRSIKITESNSLQILMNIPAIFVLLGLLDTWIKKETMISLLGESSGILGIAFAFLLGSVAAGPLYAAFPIAGMLMKKGARFLNIIVFVGAWSTTKIPMLLFEASAMGWRFMLARFVIDIPIIVIIALIVEKMVKGNEKMLIYANVTEMEQ